MTKAMLKIIFPCLFGLAALVGCKRSNDLLMYENDPGVYFYAGTNTATLDTIGANFILLPAEQLRDTVYLPLRIMGDTANRDREVGLAVVDSSTAKEGVDFQFGPKIVHAGKFSDSIELYVLRTAEQKTIMKTLYLRIVQSRDFKPGYYAYQDFKVSVTDQLVPPTWGSTMTTLFGTYSLVKFRFMVSTLQRITFTGLAYSELTAMASMCKLTLAGYELANGPLLDENGLRVFFP